MTPQNTDAEVTAFRARLIDALGSGDALRVVTTVTPEGDGGFSGEASVEGLSDEPFVMARVSAPDPAAAFAGVAEATATVITRLHIAGLLKHTGDEGT